jgi:hypothetical protein
MSLTSLLLVGQCQQTAVDLVHLLGDRCGVHAFAVAARSKTALGLIKGPAPDLESPAGGLLPSLTADPRVFVSVLDTVVTVVESRG